MQPLNLVVSDDIIIKSWDIADAPKLFALTDANRDHLVTWFNWLPKTKSVIDSEKFITNALVEMTDDKSLEMGIWQKDQLIGCIGLHDISLENYRAAIGYWLDKDHLKQGIITNSVKTLIEYCFTTLNLNRLEITAATINKPSFSIAKKLGFTREGVARQFDYINGQYLDCIHYSLLKSEWKCYH
jgi:ribosomal-protein-serine acetyltransferase